MVVAVVSAAFLAGAELMKAAGAPIVVAAAAGAAGSVAVVAGFVVLNVLG